ncbi:ABC transporter F family member 1 [Tanacetum coccineum]
MITITLKKNLHDDGLGLDEVMTLGIYKYIPVVVVVVGVVWVVGPNGAGKSTLLKLMTRELTPLKGMVKRHNHLRIAQYHQHLAEKLDLKNQTITRWNGDIMGFKEHLRTESGP